MEYSEWIGSLGSYVWFSKDNLVAVAERKGVLDTDCDVYGLLDKLFLIFVMEPTTGAAAETKQKCADILDKIDFSWV